MSGHIAIYARLNASTGLTALVGDRIYPDVMPENCLLPAVTFQKTGGGSARGSTSDPPLAWATFQVSAWARSRPDASAIAKQVRSALDRMRQVSVGGVAVDDCFYESEVDLYDADTRTYFTHTSFKLHYREAA